MNIDSDELEALLEHTSIGPALAARPEVLERLHSLQGFDGQIDAMPEGSLAFAGPASRTDGSMWKIGEESVLDLHPAHAGEDRHGSSQAARDAVARLHQSHVDGRLQGSPRGDGGEGKERDGVRPTPHASRGRARRDLGGVGGGHQRDVEHRRVRSLAHHDDGHDGSLRGPGGRRRQAITRRHGARVLRGVREDVLPPCRRRCSSTPTIPMPAFVTPWKRPTRSSGAVRIDSNVTRETMLHARKLLDSLGCPHTKIYVSDGLDEHRLADLVDVVDGFGVGENIVCSPDAAVGVGAVAKLIVNGYGALTMKVAKGTGKATLPGELQVHRFGDHDVVSLASEPSPGGRPLLEPIWRGRTPVRETSAVDDLTDARERARDEIALLPESMRALDGGGATQVGRVRRSRRGRGSVDFRELTRDESRVSESA